MKDVSLKVVLTKMQLSAYFWMEEGQLMQSFKNGAHFYTIC